MSEANHVSLTQERVGVGLRHPHYQYFLNDRQDVAFLEVHPENYFCGGKNLAILDDMAAEYSISLHGVGLSLGSAEPVDTIHVKRFKALVDRCNPLFISDHVSWSASGNAHLNDLLPLPYTEESLEAVCANIDRVQQAMGRQMLVENPSSYVAFQHSTMSEPEFINRIVERTGCGLILDINNIYVQAHNHGENALDYLRHITVSAVREMHLAGYISQVLGEKTLLIDTHSQPVCDSVWGLYHEAIKRFPEAFTLIEWDKDIPEVNVLLGEARKAAELKHMHLSASLPRKGTIAVQTPVRKFANDVSSGKRVICN